MKLIFLYIPALFLLTCTSQTDQVYLFDPSILIEKNADLSDIANDIIYTKIDNTYPVDLINQIIITDNSIFISSGQGIIKYNRDGKIPVRIGKKGRGPGEYIYNTCFAVDEIKGYVYVKDRGNVIKVFSGNGKYCRSVILNNYKGDIEKIDFFDSRIFVSFYLEFGNAEYNWILLDSLGNLVKAKKRTVPDFKSNWLAEGGTYRYNKNLYYWNPYIDTVASVRADKDNKVSFIFSPGKFRLPRSVFNVDEKITQYMLIRTLFETNRFVVLKYSYNKTGVIALIDKINHNYWVNQVSSFNNGGIMNDIDAGPDFQPVQYFTDDDSEYMVSIINSFELKNHVSNDSFRSSYSKLPEKKKELETLANNLNETDNPVIMMVKLKE